MAQLESCTCALDSLMEVFAETGSLDDPTEMPCRLFFLRGSFTLLRTHVRGLGGEAVLRLTSFAATWGNVDFRRFSTRCDLVVAELIDGRADESCGLIFRVRGQRIPLWHYSAGASPSQFRLFAALLLHLRRTSPLDSCPAAASVRRFQLAQRISRPALHHSTFSLSPCRILIAASGVDDPPASASRCTVPASAMCPACGYDLSARRQTDAPNAVGADCRGLNGSNPAWTAKITAVIVTLAGVPDAYQMGWIAGLNPGNLFHLPFIAPFSPGGHAGNRAEPGVASRG